MEIALPPGYRSAVPFDRSQHRRLSISPDAANFAAKLNVIYVAQAEMPRACHDYPLAFIKGSDEKTFPVAVTGLASNTNLFLGNEGPWAPGTYCPAYVRRYPFFTATIEDDGSEQALICVDDTALSRDGSQALISASGEPTERWQEVEILIKEMDAEQRRTDLLCERLESLSLFEPFEVDFHPHGHNPIRVQGLLRVNERKLRQCDIETLADLMKSGLMSCVYAHLLSLENFNRLLDRFVQRSTER